MAMLSRARLDKSKCTHPVLFSERRADPVPCIGSDSREANLLFFGRYQLHKAFSNGTARDMLERNPRAYAALIGMDLPSVLASSMREYAERACPRHRTRLIFIEQTPHPRLYPVITGSRFVVLPSLVDNLPNACLEAMALQKAVVGTYCPSLE